MKFHALFDLLNVFIVPGIFLIALTSSWFILAMRQNPWMLSIAVLFGVSQISVILVPWFSWLALRHYGRTTWGTVKEFALAFPPFVFLLMGLAFTMCVALVQGFRGKPAVFHRTAKYNIARPTDSWRSKLYSPREVAPLTWVEGALALFFASGLALDVLVGAWGFVPFHTSLSVGFSTMFALSVLRDA